MGDCGGGAANLRILADSGAGSHTPAVPVCDSRLSFRQRQRVHQLHGGAAVEQATHRTDQVAGASYRRQRAGRVQERRHHSQTHGFGYIDARHAEAMDVFHRQHLNPYINFHRLCAVPKILTEANGKRRRVYLRWATPFELFQEVPQCKALLRPGAGLEELRRLAGSQTDTEAALAMQRAKRKLLGNIRVQQTA